MSDDRRDESQRVVQDSLRVEGREDGTAGGRLDDRGATGHGPDGRVDESEDGTLRPGYGTPGDAGLGVAGTGSGGAGGIPLGDEPLDKARLDVVYADADKLDGDVQDGMPEGEEGIDIGGSAGAASGE